MATCKCGEINEYQEEPYVCRNCRLTTGPVLEGGERYYNPPKLLVDKNLPPGVMVFVQEEMAGVEKAMALPDLGRPSFLTELERVDAELTLTAYNACTSGKGFTSSVIQKLRELSGERYDLLNPGALEKARQMRDAHRAAHNAYYAMYGALPSVLQSMLDDEE